MRYEEGALLPREEDTYPVAVALPEAAGETTAGNGSGRGLWRKRSGEAAERGRRPQLTL